MTDLFQTSRISSFFLFHGVYLAREREHLREKEDNKLMLCLYYPWIEIVKF